MRLIDADKLKEDIKENGCDRFESWDKMLTLAEYETFVGDVIDNAPTVTPSLNLDNTTEEDVEKFKMIWQRATSKGLLPVINEEKPRGEWIPVTYRPMTEEEVKEACEKWGIKEEILEDWEKRVFTCPLPDDGQEILVSHGNYVQQDICSWDDDFCGLEIYGDWDGVDAWMPMPEPYKKGGSET